MNYFIYTSHHFTPQGRYELNKLTLLPMCGFIAQLLEQRTGNAEVTGSNPVEALIFFLFFQASSFQLLKLVNLLWWSFFTFLTGQVGTLQWNLDNMDTQKTCHTVRIIRMSVFLKSLTDTMLTLQETKRKKCRYNWWLQQKAKKVKTLIKWLHYKGHWKTDFFCWTKEKMSR